MSKDQANFSVACSNGHVRKQVITLQGKTIEWWLRLYRQSFIDAATGKSGSPPQVCSKCGRPELASTIRIEAMS
jgi:hypothetical protein